MVGGCLGGLCCLGAGALACLRMRRPRPVQRYMTVGEAEGEDELMLMHSRMHEPRFSAPVDDDDDEEPPDGEPPVMYAFARGLAALPSGPREGDLIGHDYAVTTPIAPSSAVSRESWIQEMNAELAEFDAMTATPPAPRSGTSRASGSWEESVVSERGYRLATPRTPV